MQAIRSIMSNSVNAPISTSNQSNSQKSNLAFGYTVKFDETSPTILRALLKNQEGFENIKHQYEVVRKSTQGDIFITSAITNNGDKIRSIITINGNSVEGDVSANLSPKKLMTSLNKTIRDIVNSDKFKRDPLFNLLNLKK